jgi:predicted dehydrogenase
VARSRLIEAARTAGWRGTWAMDGGSLMNQGVHYVDLLRWCMGPVTEVTAACATQAHQVEVEDTALALVRLPTRTRRRYSETPRAAVPT